MRLPFKGIYPVTQSFGNKLYREVNGQKYDVYAQWGYLGHNGIDFGTPSGTPIYAPHKGRIIEATFDVNGYGNYVKIENEKEGSVLAHMETLKVHTGYQLLEGDLIGYSGNSGYSFGDHLHWGYYLHPRDRKNGYGGFIDQMKYIKNLLDNVYKPKLTEGYEIVPAVDIPTGAEPGKATFEYGRISHTAPAKVLSIKIWNGIPYYNVDQRYIGGGTGWVEAYVVDNTPVYKPKPEAPTPLPDVEPTPEDTSEFEQLKVLYSQLKETHNDLAVKYNEYQRIGKLHNFNNPKELDVLLTNYEDAAKAIELEDKQEPEKPTFENIKYDKEENTIKFNVDWLLRLLGFNKGGGVSK